MNSWKNAKLFFFNKNVRNILMLFSFKQAMHFSVSWKQMWIAVLL